MGKGNRGQAGQGRRAKPEMPAQIPDSRKM